MNPDAEELKWTDEELLQALNCASRDGDVVRPTVAGILLFGTTLALRRFFPMMRVDYIRVPGREWVSDPDRRFDTVEIRAPLIRVIRRSRATILDDLPKAFSLPPGQLQRKDIPLVPDRVVREAMVNAVMHRSYRVHGPTQIIRYSNRLEIRNPGHSLSSGDRLGEPGSETRNPTIAAALHDANLAENKGSGIRVVRELMAQANLTPPTFESDRERNSFVVTLLFHHFLTADDWDWLRSFQEANLTDEEARALIYVREAGAISNAVYRDVNGVDVLNASLHLRRLRDRGLLTQKGKGADTYYVPTARVAVQSDKLPIESRKLGALSGDLGALSGDLGPLSGNLPPLSGMASPLSGKLESLPSRFPHLPAELLEEAAALKKRAALPVLEALVAKLCDVQALSADELGELLGRSRYYVRDQLLTPMLRAGRLTLSHPEQPNHPQQTYRALPAKGEKA